MLLTKSKVQHLLDAFNPLGPSDLGSVMPLNYPRYTCRKLLTEGLCTPGISRSKCFGHPVPIKKKALCYTVFFFFGNNTGINAECYRQLVGNFLIKENCFLLDNIILPGSLQHSQSKLKSQAEITELKKTDAH